MESVMALSLEARREIGCRGKLAIPGWVRAGTLFIEDDLHQAGLASQTPACLRQSSQFEGPDDGVAAWTGCIFRRISSNHYKKKVFLMEIFRLR
jgi:hypothetical protein